MRRNGQARLFMVAVSLLGAPGGAVAGECQDRHLPVGGKRVYKCAGEQPLLLGMQCPPGPVFLQSAHPIRFVAMTDGVYER